MQGGLDFRRRRLRREVSLVQRRLRREVSSEAALRLRLLLGLRPRLEVLSLEEHQHLHLAAEDLLRHRAPLELLRRPLVVAPRHLEPLELLQPLAALQLRRPLVLQRPRQVSLGALPPRLLERLLLAVSLERLHLHPVVSLVRLQLRLSLAGLPQRQALVLQLRPCLVSSRRRLQPVSLGVKRQPRLPLVLPLRPRGTLPLHPKARPVLLLATWAEQLRYCLPTPR